MRLVLSPDQCIVLYSRLSSGWVVLLLVEDNATHDLEETQIISVCEYDIIDLDPWG